MLAGALLRVVDGMLVDRIGAEAHRHDRPGHRHRWACWPPGWFGVHSFAQVLLLGVVLGVAGASFAVALPLASRWYPPEYQGIALGIAGAGNSGTVFAALFAPGLAAAFGWNNVLGLAADPARRRLRRLPGRSRKDARTAPPPKSLAEYLAVLQTATPGGSCSSTPSPSAASSASPPR